ncbi:transcription antitermination factor NusB [Singulisphaera acidiphila]|uniref:Transcription antitermination protein NusB n=1 Tax=Singulisphaera acidiphila (strain ATCC BAA-1392 / DSM 18658 / VKM B-2454 / MOB10) TaxID=886293 RepID=L0DPS2_SINAD|nr:transcription antitermination factor NusB [Singulisphaera acidiphila]AGA30843.1 transcription antitermination factor NusB [Singulisphaera acidiphila DSM 18658]
MTRRTRGREIALQVLYQTEQNPGLAPQEIRRFVDRRLRGDKKLCEFAEALIAGVQANQPRIDELISAVAENWRLDRMAAIDRNILRLGAFELLYCADVPTKVAINESLELAKRYSTAQSSRFVNGILDRLQAAELASRTAPVIEAEPVPAPQETPLGEVDSAQAEPQVSPEPSLAVPAATVETSDSPAAIAPTELAAPRDEPLADSKPIEE